MLEEAKLHELESFEEFSGLQSSFYFSVQRHGSDYNYMTAQMR